MSDLPARAWTAMLAAGRCSSCSSPSLSPCRHRGLSIRWPSLSRSSSRCSHPSCGDARCRRRRSSPRRVRVVERTIDDTHGIARVALRADGGLVERLAVLSFERRRAHVVEIKTKRLIRFCSVMDDEGIVDKTFRIHCHDSVRRPWNCRCCLDRRNERWADRHIVTNCTTTPIHTLSNIFTPPTLDICHIRFIERNIAHCAFLSRPNTRACITLNIKDRVFNDYIAHRFAVLRTADASAIFISNLDIAICNIDVAAFAILISASDTWIKFFIQCYNLCIFNNNITTGIVNSFGSSPISVGEKLASASPQAA